MTALVAGTSPCGSYQAMVYYAEPQSARIMTRTES